MVAVVGDGAMTGGVNFEALLNAGGLETPIVIVLNDNGMSISPNVGALSRYFNRVRLEPTRPSGREAVEAGLTRLPAGIGARIERLGPQLKESIKAFWAPGALVRGARPRLRGSDRRPRRAGAARGAAQALMADRPVVVHIKTVKGRASRPPRRAGLEGMEKWHAAKPESVKDGRVTASARSAEATARAHVKPAAPVHRGVRPCARRGGAPRPA